MINALVTPDAYLRLDPLAVTAVVPACDSGQMPELDPNDEQRHTPGAEPFWNESYYLDFFDAEGGLGGYVRVGLYPNLDAVWYWACLVGPDRRLVTVVDHDVPLPAKDDSLQLHHAALWADNVIEKPTEHMRVALEAHAVSLDDPADTYRGLRGDKVPLAMELDWETDRSAYRWPPIQDRYEIPCRVSGEIQLAEGTIEFDGWGQRDHSWGVRDWWTMPWHWDAGRLDDGTRFHCSGGFGPGSEIGFGYILPAGSDTFEDVTRVVVDADLGDEGIPLKGQVEMNDLSLEVEPIAWSPVLLVAPDGRESRFPRAMARFTASDGRKGLGWVEWNQPQP